MNKSRKFSRSRMKQEPMSASFSNLIASKSLESNTGPSIEARPAPDLARNMQYWCPSRNILNISVWEIINLLLPVFRNDVSVPSLVKDHTSGAALACNQQVKRWSYCTQLWSQPFHHLGHDHSWRPKHNAKKSLKETSIWPAISRSNIGTGGYRLRVLVDWRNKKFNHPKCMDILS